MPTAVPVFRLESAFSTVRRAATAKRKGEGSEGITRLHKRSAEGGETEPEGAALALEREVRR
jgi:hypothetical protein